MATTLLSIHLSIYVFIYSCEMSPGLSAAATWRSARVLVRVQLTPMGEKGGLGPETWQRSASPEASPLVSSCHRWWSQVTHKIKAGQREREDGKGVWISPGTSIPVTTEHVSGCGVVNMRETAGGIVLMYWTLLYSGYKRQHFFLLFKWH